MIGLLCFVLAVLASPFRSRLRLEAEKAALRYQLMVLLRKLHGRVRLTNHDRWFFIQLYRWFPSILSVLTIIRFGRATHPRRTAQARVEIAQSSVAKYMVKRREPPNQGWRTFLAQPRAGDCRHRPVRCSNYRVRPALCLRRPPAGPQRALLDQRHRKSDGGMGCPPNHRGISLG
jgi:hypothetical protein